MQILISNKVHARIKQFYYNAMLKYPNTYSPDDADRDWDKVTDELSQVGTSLLKTNTTIKEWQGYNVCRSKNWYFAYKVQDEKVYVYDARHGQNMNDKAHVPQFSNNNNQQQTQYTAVSGECFGMTMVKSNNGLFNFVNQNNQLFCKEWYKGATDFAKYSNGTIAATVSNGTEKFWLHLDSGVLEKMTNNSTIPESKESISEKLLFEQQIREHRDLIREEKEKFEFYLNYNPKKGGQLKNRGQ